MSAFQSTAHHHHTQDDLHKLLSATGMLIRADNQVTLHEYCLQHLLLAMTRKLMKRGTVKLRSNSLAQCRDAIATLYAVTLSHASAMASTEVHKTWRTAMERILPGQPVSFSVPKDWQGAMDGALRNLDLLASQDKRRVSEGFAALVRADAKLNSDEDELLRTLCAVLQCPPPQATLGADSVGNKLAKQERGGDAIVAAVADINPGPRHRPASKF